MVFFFFYLFFRDFQEACGTLVKEFLHYELNGDLNNNL